MRTILSIAAATLAVVTAARADIYQWEYINPADPSQGKRQSTTLCPDGAGVDAVPGANFYNRNLTMAYLDGADLMNAIGKRTNLTKASFVGANLSGAHFTGDGSVYYSETNLTDADLSQANLRDANFAGADLTNAGLTGTDIREASFNVTVDNVFFDLLFGGLTLAQLYSTASYQTYDLAGINLGGNDLTGGNFAHQNLTNSSFGPVCYASGHIGCFWSYWDIDATLTGTDFTGADARGAQDFSVPASSITTNLIRPDGHVIGLDLDVGALLVVRDYDGDPARTFYGTPTPIPPIAIIIDQHMVVGPGGTLRMVFEADAWDSTISFAPGIPVTLGGALELTFATDVNLASQVGRTFDLFNWTGVNPTGAFAVSSPYAWNLSNLYTTGQVTLTAIPEPATFALALLCVFGLATHVERGIRVSPDSCVS